MNFLKSVLAAFVALIIFSVMAFFVFIGSVSLMTADEKVVVQENSVLHLELNTPISERTFEDPFDGFAGGTTMGIIDLKEAILHARDNDKIKGIYLNINYLMAGFGQGQELRKALESFKSSGKFIIAYSDFMSEGGYYISSVADSIFLHPEGDLEFNGISYGVTFLKGTLDKLEIEPQIFRVGEFKSAVEPFIRKDMSEENKMQVASFINDIYDNLLDEISTSRGLEVENVRSISSGMQVRKVEDAVALNLIDGLKYDDELKGVLETAAGVKDEEEINLITYGKYRKSMDVGKSSSNRIAVIMANGEIIFGEGEERTIGAKKFVKEIRKARKNKKVKAIVLRINSPGGNFIASDEIWREVYVASQAKPVIASMSNYAASGGYYIAMAADSIVAYPNTITGSIGIFSILFNMNGFLENKLGLTSDVVNTGQFSDIFTISRGLTDEEKSIFQKQAEDGYESFITKAASGRNMSVEEIQNLASGRVWTGSQALDNGLVDLLGTFDDAVRLAAQKADIVDDYKLRYYPVQKTFWEQILSEFGQEVQMRIVKSRAGDLYPYLDILTKLKNYEGVQARLPYDVITKF